MVQVTFDTARDSLEELEQAMQVLSDAIARKRGGTVIASASTAPAPPQEEEATLETPFLKITVKDMKEVPERPSTPQPGVPTLNQLLTDESLSEEEISKLFKEAQKLDEDAAKETPAAKKRGGKDPDAYIEIVEFDEEK